MSLLDAFPATWRVTVTVTGPVARDEDGHLTTATEPVAVTGCLIAPGTATTPGLLDPTTSQDQDDTATLYAPPGAPIRHLDTVTVPAPHPLAGTWHVQDAPAPWPLGLAATLTRR